MRPVTETPPESPERITLDRSHFVAPVDHVNPLRIVKGERTGAMERIAPAFPVNPDPFRRKKPEASVNGPEPAALDRRTANCMVRAPTDLRSRIGGETDNGETQFHID